MESLANVVKHFVYRDAAYIVGGASVIVSFLYLFHHIEFLQVTKAGALLVAGIAYAIGFAIQEGLSLIKLVTTSLVDQPPKLIRHLYKRWDGEWELLSKGEAKSALDEVWARDTKGSFIAELQRVESLIVIAAALGSCSLVSGAFIAIKAWWERSPFDGCMAIGVLLIGVILACDSWLKSATLAQHGVRYAKELRKKKNNIVR